MRMKKVWKHKIFSRKVKKRVTALSMAVILLCTSVGQMAPQASAAKVDTGAVAKVSNKGMDLEKEKYGILSVAGRKAVSSLRAYGKHVVADTLTSVAAEIDEATGTDTASKTASWIRTYVMGDTMFGLKAKINEIADKVNQILDICNQMVIQLDRIESEIINATSVTDALLANSNIADAKSRLESEWTKATIPAGVEAAGNVQNVLDDFKVYVKTAKMYKNNDVDEKGDPVTEEAVKKAEDAYVRSMWNNIYCNGSGPQQETYQMYLSSYVSSVYYSTFEGMVKQLNKEGKDFTYTDYAAQYAYESMGFTSDQYDFIMNCMDRQLMEICYLALMWQDFIGRSSEYLEDNPDIKDNYQYMIDQELSDFGNRMGKFADAIYDRLNRPIYFNPTTSNVSVKLSQYLTNRDEQSMNFLGDYEDITPEKMQRNGFDYTYTYGDEKNNDFTAYDRLVASHLDIKSQAYRLAYKPVPYDWTGIQMGVLKSNGTVDTFFAGMSNDIVAEGNPNNMDRFDSFFDTNFYVANGSIPYNYLQSKMELASWSHRYIVPHQKDDQKAWGDRKDDRDYEFTVSNMDKVQRPGQWQTEQLSVRYDWKAHEGHIDYIPVFMLAVPKEKRESQDENWFDYTPTMVVRQSSEFADSSKKILYTEQGKPGDTFTLSIPKEIKEKDANGNVRVKVPVSVSMKTRRIYTNDSLVDIVDIGKGEIENVTNTSETNILDYNALQTLSAFSEDISPKNQDKIEIDLPVPYFPIVIYDVEYDYPVGDVENVEAICSNGSDQVSVAFDVPENAAVAKVYISSDPDFIVDAMEKTVDLTKVTGTTCKVTYDLEPNMVGKKIYVMVEGQDTRSYRQTKNPFTYYGTSAATNYNAPDVWYDNSDLGYYYPSEAKEAEKLIPRKYADYTLSGGSVTAAAYPVVLSPAEIDEVSVLSLQGDVRVTLANKVDGMDDYEVQYYEVQFSQEKDNFKEGSTIISKIMDKKLTATYRIPTAKHYFVRARAVAKNPEGDVLYGEWSSEYARVSTEVEFVNIEDIQVLDPPNAVSVTAAEFDASSEGYRFVAFSENVPVDKIRTYFTTETVNIDQQYKKDVKYVEIDKNGDLTQVFSELEFIKWYFFVQSYTLDESGKRHYSDVEDGFSDTVINLRPHVKVDEVELISEEEVTVSCLDDYTSTSWKAQVIDPSDKSKIYDEKTVSVDTESVTLVVPRKHDVEIRVSSWRDDPDTGKKIEGAYDSSDSSGYQPYDSQLADLSMHAGISFFNVVGDGEIRVELDNISPYTTNFKYELYRSMVAPNNLVDSTTTTSTSATFTGLTETEYVVIVTPYLIHSDGKHSGTRDDGDSSRSEVYYKAPGLGSTMLLYSDVFTDTVSLFVSASSEGQKNHPSKIIIQMDETKSFKNPTEGVAFYRPDSIWKNITSEYSFFNGTITGKMSGDHFLRVCSVWQDPNTGKEIYSSWSMPKAIYLNRIPKFDTFMDWILEHAKPVESTNVTVTDDIAGTYVFSEAISSLLEPDVEIAGASVAGVEMLNSKQHKLTAGADQSDEVQVLKYKVNLPESIEAKMEFDGLTVLLTTDKAGSHVVAREYLKGREVTVIKQNNGEYLDKNKRYYIWISPFNFGDDEETVVLNGGFAGPFITLNGVDGGDDQKKPDTGKKDPGSSNGEKNNQKTTSGLDVGKKATAGSGSTKAVYKATGKDTVTYLKAKVKKSAKTVTVPATVKINGKKYKVTKIAKSAFKGYKKLTTVVVKPTSLKKNSVKECFKGTSVKTVKVPKKQYKKYKKFFTKKVTKSKVKVTVKKSK